MNYVPHTPDDQAKMLKKIGVDSVTDLFCDVPANLRLADSLQMNRGMSEQDVVKHVTALAEENKTVLQYDSYLGGGAYEHFIPSFVDQLLMRSEFYTAYTPYQPEISQGTLQAIYEFQSMVCELTGMDLANASMYDGATALAEACLMACEVTKRKKVIVPRTVHPEYREVLAAYCSSRGIEPLEAGYLDGKCDQEALVAMISQEIAAVVIQTPNFFGALEEAGPIARIAHEYGALVIGAVNPVSLGLFKSPGQWGADIAVGEGQPLGTPLNYGGPYLGFIACKEKYMRRLPGRIAGMTKDKNGKRGFVLTLQAREQHIRREKATSNICSNQALCALAFTMHLSALGKQGLKELADLNIQKAHYAAGQIAMLPGMRLAFSSPFFNEFVIETEVDPSRINAVLLEDRIIGGLELGRFYPELKNHLLLCVTETKSKSDIDRLVARLGEIR